MIKKKKYQTYRWDYDPYKDELICPEGEKLKYLYTRNYKTDSGWQSSRRMYKCDSCDKCEVREEYTRSEFRQAAFNPQLWKQKQVIKEKLSSQPGALLMRRRRHEVETVFGQIKGDMGFRRFQTTGTNGISTEWGLLMMGYNMKNILRHGI